MKYIGESIVFLVDGNSPSTFNERFISHHNIYPNELEIEDSIKLPPLSQIKFSDGYAFQAVDNKIKLEYKVEEAVEVKGGITPNITVKNSAIKLAKAVPYIDYYALGINFTLFIEDYNLNSLNTKILKGFDTNVLKISKQQNPFTLNVNFYKVTNGTNFEINLHHQLDKGNSKNIEKFCELIEGRDEFFQGSLDEIKSIIK